MAPPWMPWRENTPNIYFISPLFLFLPLAKPHVQGVPAFLLISLTLQVNTLSRPLEMKKELQQRL